MTNNINQQVEKLPGEEHKNKRSRWLVNHLNSFPGSLAAFKSNILTLELLRERDKHWAQLLSEAIRHANAGYEIEATREVIKKMYEDMRQGVPEEFLLK